MNMEESMHYPVNVDKAMEVSGLDRVSRKNLARREKGRARSAACSPEGYGGNGTKPKRVSFGKTP
jgi:hypothetical protein